MITGWNEQQQARMAELMETPGVEIAYWCSDVFGRPANGGTSDGWFAVPGLIQEVDADKLEICKPGALHATLTPHSWRGARVWVVALSGKIERQEDKLAASCREFLGEVFPEHAWTDSVGARLGRKDLSSADLRYADLRYADLSNADLGK